MKTDINGTVIKRIVDLVMTTLMMSLMAYQVTGEFAHEWIGVGMTLLVIIHQILNRKWYMSILKGIYNFLRIYIVLVDVLLLISFALTAISGISMSNHAVPILYGLLPISFARTMHLSLSHWAFILMGLHIGIHVPQMTSQIKMSGKTRMAFLILFCIFSGVGFFIFIRSEIVSYLTFQTHFAFLDYEKSEIMVFLENILMLVLWGFLGMQFFNLLKKPKGETDES